MEIKKWTRPPQGWYKINCDAAVDGKNGRMGVGLILIDHDGGVLATGSFTKKGWLDPTTVEVMATIRAAQFCKEMDVSNVLIEGDAQKIIQALQNGDQNGSRYGQLVEDAKLILTSLMNWKPNYVRRNVNGAAHILAKMATRHIVDCVWRDGILDCICDIIQAEQIASA
ncbi:uncharacterized protein LOC132178227 [Corylus avellana]|uniref:uncharacterized protein LOC132178227 n=1 Tax=Corylus avellana TaxID=13451 RepID=UPI00286C91E9|nr:uncharacterized protein LOC132178227 [Corylus avellana]